MPPPTRLLTRQKPRHIPFLTTLPTSTPTRKPYHSIHHPNPPSYPPIQTTILTSALSHVPRLGFTRAALLAGLKDNSYREASLSLFPRGPYDLIHFYLVTQRLALSSRVQFPSSSTDGTPKTTLSLTEKVHTLLWTRLLANADTANNILPHWQAALAHMSLLENIPSSLRELGLLSDEIWYLAGDKQVDFGWYTKRAQLAGVYASAEVYMTTDTSVGYEGTREFLGRRLESARVLGGVVGGVKGYMGWAVGNGVGLARSLGFRV